MPTANHVPPLRFLTALTACSTVRPAGLLHPAADPGVRRVSGLARLCFQSRLPAFLTDAIPFEAFPSSPVARCFHLAFPLAVSPPRGVRLQGFADAESVAGRMRFRSRLARCSHGLWFQAVVPRSPTVPGSAVRGRNPRCLGIPMPGRVLELGAKPAFARPRRFRLRWPPRLEEARSPPQSYRLPLAR